LLPPSTTAAAAAAAVVQRDDQVFHTVGCDISNDHLVDPSADVAQNAADLFILYKNKQQEDEENMKKIVNV